MNEQLSSCFAVSIPFVVYVLIGTVYDFFTLFRDILAGRQDLSVDLSKEDSEEHLFHIERALGFVGGGGIGDLPPPKNRRELARKKEKKVSWASRIASPLRGDKSLKSESTVCSRVVASITVRVIYSNIGRSGCSQPKHDKRSQKHLYP